MKMIYSYRIYWPDAEQCECAAHKKCPQPNGSQMRQDSDGRLMKSQLAADGIIQLSIIYKHANITVVFQICARLCLCVCECKRKHAFSMLWNCP